MGILHREDVAGQQICAHLSVGRPNKISGRILGKKLSEKGVGRTNNEGHPKEGRRAMTKHMTGTRKEWLAARLELLKAEKELTRRGDELARRRQELPWVRIDKAYRFETDQGSASLADLFRGRSQLLVYHFMFGPDYKAGCATCSTIADGFNGFVVHLANHDVMLSAVSRAPLAKLQAYKKRMGWTFPWASSFGNDFNPDFNISFTEEQQREGGIEYNYRREAPLTVSGVGDSLTKREGPEADNAAMTGTDVATYTRERPGMSAVVLEDGVVYHTSSAYARGLDALWGMYPWLDRAPRGRNETGMWWRHHDRYPERWVSNSHPERSRGICTWTETTMMWMRMPGQTWTDAGASFVGMWVVMMAAMMLPSLVPVLWRYRRMIGDRLTALVGVGYLFVWAVLGTIVFPLGVALMEFQMREPSFARLAPVAIGAAVLLAGVVQLTPWKARHLALCRDASFHGCAPRRGAGAAWRHGLRLGVLCVRSCAGLTAVLLALG